MINDVTARVANISKANINTLIVGGNETIDGNLVLEATVINGGGVTGIVASPLNYYEQDNVTSSVLWTFGGTTSTATSITITRIGDIVCVNIPAIPTITPAGGAGLFTAVSSVAIPARFRPLVQKIVPAIALLSTSPSQVAASLIVGTNGIFTFQSVGGGTFVSSTTFAAPSQGITYLYNI